MGAKRPPLTQENQILGLYPASLADEDLVRLGQAFARSIGGGERRRVAAPLRVAVGFDTRHSSWDLQNSLVRGVAAGGVNVINLGHAPSPLVLFSAARLKLDGAVIVTGSHRSHQWNGVRFYTAGRPLDRDEIDELRSRAFDMAPPTLLPLTGEITYINMVPDYLRRLEKEFAPLERATKRKPIRVVTACHHGVASLTAPFALSRAGCRVARLGCTLTAVEDAPPPDPSDPALLRELGSMVRASSSDLGVAFDGDGDRIRAVDQEGEVIAADDIFALLAADVARTVPGARIAGDLRTGQVVADSVERNGGTLLLVPPGHRSLMNAVGPDRALLGGEVEGNYYFADRYLGIDDGTYASLRLVEILAAARKENGPRTAIGAILPGDERFRAPEKVISWRRNRNAMNRFADHLRERKLLGDPILSIDAEPRAAVRVRCDNGWGVFYRSPEDGDLHLLYESTSEPGFHETGAILREALSRAMEPAGTPETAGSGRPL